MEDYFQLIGEAMGFAWFKCSRPCNLTDNVRLYDIISKRYEYLKSNEMISMEYDVNTKSYILRLSLDKGIFGIKPLEQEPRHSLKKMKRFKNSESSENSENSWGTNSLESFKSFDTVHWFVILLIC